MRLVVGVVTMLFATAPDPANLARSAPMTSTSNWPNSWPSSHPDSPHPPRRLTASPPRPEVPMFPLEALDRPAWLPESVWPWPTDALTTGAGRIAVTDAGTGPVLLLVHTGMWSFVWRDLTSQFRCVTLDAPGNGRSDRPGAPGTTLAASANAVQAVIDALDLRDVTLVAHDLGGVAGFAAAAGRPDRIAALVAVNTFGWRPSGPAFRGMLAMMGSGVMRELDALTGWLPAAASGRFGVGRHWNRADRAAFRAGIDREGRRSIHRYLADARRADAVYATVEAALRGPFANRPLLTVFGQYNDPLRLQPRWKAMFPSARQEVVAKGYHFPMCDAPAAVAGWIRQWHATEVHPSRSASTVPGTTSPASGSTTTPAGSPPSP
jgi:pimeloyl-ACP methyl ester carboxylesterase